VDTTAAVLELYGLPPEDFTAARNELAKAARAAGDVAASAQVKALGNRHWRRGWPTSWSAPSPTESTS